PLSYFLATIQKVGIASFAIIIVVIVLYYIKKKVTKRTVVDNGPTWGCGYLVPSPKIQYTSGSFSRTYRNLIKPLLKIQKHEKCINTVVPGRATVETHVLDKIEYMFIDIPVRHLKSFIGRFTFLQNGSVQFYILYGVVFIFIAITIPFLIRATYSIIDLFKQL
ncbi:MAG TPA: hypothetical protein VHO90_20050, partial [Bacteroidales bacterium]|nr:hypothetical protein [Bacteroidales bacterium]